MSIRTNDARVRSTLAPGNDYDLVNNPSLTRFIKIASLIVDRVDSCATDRGFTMTSDELLEIETWLAAHYYCMSDATYQSRSTASASGSFRGQTTMHMEATLYGQSAIDADYSGCLAAINKRAFAGVDWLGKVPSDQIPYRDRD